MDRLNSIIKQAKDTLAESQTNGNFSFCSDDFTTSFRVDLNNGYYVNITVLDFDFHLANFEVDVYNHKNRYFKHSKEFKGTTHIKRYVQGVFNNNAVTDY